MLDRLAWTIVGIVGVVTITQVIGWSGGISLAAVAQTLTPYVGLLLLPICVVGIWRRRYALVTVAAGCGCVLLVLSAPVAFPDDQPDPVAGATGLRVATANLWYENTQITDVADALAQVDADVIIFNEYTAEHQRALTASTLSRAYPYRIDMSGRGATGIALWSKYRSVVNWPRPTHLDSIDATVAGPDGDVRVLAMHMTTPLDNFTAWRDDLALAARIGRQTAEPLLLIGDLNSSYWHPDFRHLLDAGFVDAHMAAGTGFTSSWPTTMIMPSFVRLDHALTAGGLVSTDVDDFEIPGSDHRGFVVTVAPTPPAAP